jgi:hypothetical protein
MILKDRKGMGVDGILVGIGFIITLPRRPLPSVRG